MRRNQEGIKVYTRKVSGSAILEYKAGIIVKAPADQVIALFEDDEKVPLWFYHGCRANLVEPPDGNTKLYYFVARFPWPASARDIVFERIKSRDPVTGEIRYTLKAVPDRLPRKRGIVRVRHLKTSWNFTPLPDGRTEIHFQQHSHPEGFIPPFIANKLVVDIPFYSLRNFRGLVESLNP